MLYNGYDALIDKAIINTDRMVAVNSIDHLALGYKSAKKFIKEFSKYKKDDLTQSILCDIERCKAYCKIIDDLCANKDA